LTRSFTLIELLVVIIIIGIIVSTLSFNFSPNQLDLAADQIIKDIRLTQSLALKDDKYQPFPENNTSIEENRSKYWFKQWWQIKFEDKNNTIYYEIFSDKPLFDTNASDNEVLKVNGIYKTGKDNNNSDIYMNLTKKYGIKKIDANNTFIFDNEGNIFLNEGNDTNPLDKTNKLLTQPAKIKLCNKLNSSNNCLTDKKHCIAIEITPTGSLEKTTCN